MFWCNLPDRIKYSFASRIFLSFCVTMLVLHRLSALKKREKWTENINIILFKYESQVYECGNVYVWVCGLCNGSCLLAIKSNMAFLAKPL